MTIELFHNKLAMVNSGLKHCYHHIVGIQTFLLRTWAAEESGGTSTIIICTCAVCRIASATGSS